MCIGSMRAFGAAAMLCVLPMAVQAKVCDYKPSRLAGAAASHAGSALEGAGATVRAGVREGAQAAGNYMLMHPGQSIKLVAGTASTVSGAATGAGGLAASAGAVLTAPVTLVAGAITFAAAGSYEGLCYFQVERVTDPQAVRAIIDDISKTDPLVWTRNTNSGPVMVLAGPEGETIYPIRKLYIADGLLKVRDWGLNSTLGPIAYVAPEEALVEEVGAAPSEGPATEEPAMESPDAPSE